MGIPFFWLRGRVCAHSRPAVPLFDPKWEFSETYRTDAQASLRIIHTKTARTGAERVDQFGLFAARVPFSSVCPSGTRAIVSLSPTCAP